MDAPPNVRPKGRDSDHDGHSEPTARRESRNKRLTAKSTLGPPSGHEQGQAKKPTEGNATARRVSAKTGLNVGDFWAGKLFAEIFSCERATPEGCFRPESLYASRENLLLSRPEA